MPTKNSPNDRSPLSEGAIMEALGRHGRALHVARVTGEEVQAVCKQWRNCAPEQTAGRVAETMHTGSFNADAVLKGRVDLTAATTASGGNGHAAVDIEILRRGKLVGGAQVKYCGDTAKTTFSVSAPKYDGLQKVVPAEQAAGVRDLAKRRGTSGIGQRNYPDTAQKASDRVRLGGVESKPLSTAEAVEAAKNPKAAAQRLFAAQAGQAVKAGGVIGGVIAGGLSAATNAHAVWARQKGFSDAAVDVAKDTACGALDGAAKGAVTVGTEMALARVGAQVLAGSSAPVAIAITAVDVAKDVGSLMAGDIEASEFGGRACRNVVKGGCTWGGMEAGAAIGTAICPGVGTIVGGIIGGIGGSLFGGLLV